MIALLLSAAAPLAPPPVPGDDFQIMTSPAFEVLARRTDALCPARHLRYLKPAELDGELEGFAATLSHREQRRLDRANAGTNGCVNQSGGLSCPAQHELAAVVRLGMLEPFAAYACQTQP